MDTVTPDGLEKGTKHQLKRLADGKGRKQSFWLTASVKVITFTADRREMKVK